MPDKPTCEGDIRVIRVREQRVGSGSSCERNGVGPFAAAIDQDDTMGIAAAERRAMLMRACLRVQAPMGSSMRASAMQPVVSWSSWNWGFG